MDKGIYCLVFENPACAIGIGALGPVPFPAGWHIYVGSALGSGGPCPALPSYRPFTIKGQGAEVACRSPLHGQPGSRSATPSML